MQKTLFENSEHEDWGFSGVHWGRESYGPLVVDISYGQTNSGHNAGHAQTRIRPGDYDGPEICLTGRVKAPSFVKLYVEKLLAFGGIDALLDLVDKASEHSVAEGRKCMQAQMRKVLGL